MSKLKEEYLFNPYDVNIEESSEVNEILDYTDILAEVSKAIINYRNSKNITQKQLAEILNMNQSMISKLESGNYNATFKMLLKISYILENNSNLFVDIIENIRKVLTVKYQFNDVNINKEYNYKIKNDNTKLYSLNNYTWIYTNKGNKIEYKCNIG